MEKMGSICGHDVYIPGERDIVVNELAYSAIKLMSGALETPKTDTVILACKSCKFWDFSFDEKALWDVEGEIQCGFCYRYPPARGGEYQDVNYDWVTDFNLPVVRPHHWCGEWRGKAENQPGRRPAANSDKVKPPEY